MTTFALLPGAGGAAWYWSRVAPLLGDAGHDAIAINLPADDERAGLREYAQLAVDAIGSRADIAAEGAEHDRDEAEVAFTSPCDFTAWPAVPIRVLSGRDDRLFPADFQRRVARERLAIEADVLPGGHLIALAQPRAVADYLLVTELR